MKYLTGSSIIATVISIILVILLYIYVLPESKRPQLNKLLTFIHDFLTIKNLWIEKIFRFFYVLSAVSSLIFGIFLLFKDTTFLAGIALILFGPIASRITYEAMLLPVLLVQNAIEINERLKKK
jgi:hypothetical protein